MPTDHDDAQALVFMRHHLNPTLQLQYLTVTSAYALWVLLRNRFNHQQTMFLPKAHYNWIHLQVQDYPTIARYIIEMYKIASWLSLYGEPIDDAQMIEKTLSTFHAADIILAQQYQNILYMKYLDLMSVLLLAKKHDKLLLKNHGEQPTRTFSMRSHATYVPTMQFTSQGSRRRLKPEKKS